MSTLKLNAVQIGQSVTATNNFTLFQPTVPDGTVRLGVGNADSVSTVMTFTSQSVSLPSGSTAQRPAVSVNGMIRYNTTLDVTEEYRSDEWQTLSSVGGVTTGKAIAMAIVFGG